MHLAAYDWRLSLKNLEVRDRFFSRLQNSIEHTVKDFGKKVVLISHSMGVLVTWYFFNWVASPMGGNGGEYWVDDHIESFINIAGCVLGVPKVHLSKTSLRILLPINGVPAQALLALISGETRDTAQFNR
jgi:phospholipid:diacylglycerol acyltransferase